MKGPTGGVGLFIRKGQDNRTNIPKRDTDGSDQSSHSTLKPLHQPISPISPPNKHSRAKERGGDEARRGGVHRGRGDDGRREGFIHKGQDNRTNIPKRDGRLFIATAVP